MPMNCNNQMTIECTCSSKNRMIHGPEWFTEQDIENGIANKTLMSRSYLAHISDPTMCIKVLYEFMSRCHCIGTGGIIQPVKWISE